MTRTVQTLTRRMETPALPGVLVEPGWLRERLGHPRLSIVDMREADAYQEAHVPGAAHLALADLGAERDLMENVLLPAPDFSRLMSGLGVSDGDVVVAYDDQWGLPAARLLWALHYYGYPTVAVLNGGWDRWKAEGGPAVDGFGPRKTQGAFHAARRPDVAADLAWIRKQVAAGDAVLVDTRSPQEFVRGHLPGALSWDWFNAVPATSWNCLRDPGELEAEWRELGLEPEGEVVVYCRSGMRAAHTYLALRHTGFSRVRLYDGSWQEWSMKEEGRSDT